MGGKSAKISALGAMKYAEVWKGINKITYLKFIFTELLGSGLATSHAVLF
jgi:hypothetical protein